MRAAPPCLLGLLLSTACPAADGETPVAGTSSGGEMSSSSSAATFELPSGETGSSGSSATETSGVTATSLDEGSSSGGSPETTTSTSGGGGAVYSAIALPGGLDRVRIHKADFDAGTCTWVVLVAPPIGTMYPSVDVPKGWSVESAAINDVAGSCDEDTPSMFGAEAASAASGSIGFGRTGEAGIYPCTVEVDATLEFQGLLPGVPTMDALMVSDLEVTGC